MEKKFIECTGSPKPFFSKKEVFLSQMAEHGFGHGKMTKKDNKVSILACSSYDDESAKMETARSLGVEIMTYEDLMEAFNLEGDQ